MNIDESYIKELLIPLKGTVGVQISDYLSSLKSNGVDIKHKNGLVDEKFIAHFEHLVHKGIITNSSGRVTLDSFGLGIGSNRHITHWNCSYIMFIEPHTPNPQVSNTINISGAFKGNLQAGVSNQTSESPNKSIIKWLLNHLVTVICGVAVVLIVGLLGIKT